MKIKCKIKKGDTVKVITGSDKGKVGEVLQVFPQESKVLVDNMNIVKKHKKSEEGGGIMNKSMPIHVSNVSFFDGNNCSRIGYKYPKDKKKCRFLKKSGELLND